MSQVKKFFGILRLEMEDVEEDLESMIHVYQRRNSEGQVSEYVLKNNSALFVHEINSIADFIRQLDQDCCADYKTVDEVIDHINKELPSKVKEFDYPQVVVNVVRRKMEKVRAYLEMSS